VRFGRVDALSDVNFAFETGVVGIIGPNGSGKTTALNVLSGLVRLSRGTASVVGRDLSTMRANQVAHLGVARTFQTSRILEWTNVRENVAVALSAEFGAPNLRRNGLSEADDLAEASLAAVGLASLANTRASTLSYGERKLVELARVHARRPLIALLDEPVSGLHPSNFPIVADVIRQVAARGGLVILVEHNHEFVGEVAGQVVALSAGRLTGLGAPADVLSNRDVIMSFGGAGDARD
jgi:ABC-type branched-subunit amino acid transport system ATPase component